MSVISGILYNYNAVPFIAPQPERTIELISSSSEFKRFLGLCGIDLSELLLLIRSTETPLPASTGEIIDRTLENYDTKKAAILSGMIDYLRSINSLPAYARKRGADYSAERRENAEGIPPVSYDTESIGGEIPGACLEQLYRLTTEAREGLARGASLFLR